MTGATCRDNRDSLMIRKPSQDTEILVCKRDGTREPFVVAKLLHCIWNGLVASGEPIDLDTTTAGALAEAVSDYLKASYAGKAVPADHLADLVELVLTQTGHDGAAIAIREHHRTRQRDRRRLMVATARPRDGRFAQQPWRKQLVVQHLRRQHRLEPPTARLIAGRVERLLLDCGLPVVTSGLVREMARSELLAWGLLPGALVVKRTGRRPRGRPCDDSTEKET